MPVNDPPLTDREKRLLRRLAEQKSDTDIASEMGGTAAQIAVQRERLLARLGIVSRSDVEKAARTLARWPYRQSKIK
jgi:DNA-binding CsgD family transcriptional regulator